MTRLEAELLMSRIVAWLQQRHGTAANDNRHSG